MEFQPSFFSPTAAVTNANPEGRLKLGWCPILCSFSVRLFWGQAILKASGDSVRISCLSTVAGTYPAVTALPWEPFMERVS